MYAAIENPYGFDRTVQMPVGKFNFSHDPEPLACFNYKGYSWVFYRLGDPILHIERAHDERTFELNISIFSFDQMTSTLYFFTNETQQLYRFNLDILEKFWTVDNYSQELVKARRNVAMDILYSPVEKLDGVDKLMIFNNTIYYRTVKMELKKKIIGINDSQKLKHNSVKLDFIMFVPFLKLLDLLKDNNSQINTLLSSSTVISLPLPVLPPESSGVLTYILYVINVGIVLTIFYFYRKKHNLNETSDNKFKHNDVYLDIITR
jgi:hypothetical protein